jgi:NDP-sugar pyrophosphorylase family protein
VIFAPAEAIVLTAGIGSRLRPLTCVRAKAAVPVAGVPLVRRILRGLAAQGLRRVVLNLHHRPATITRLVGDGADLGLQVRYSWEPVLLGPAGGPRHALPLLCGRFLLVNGDTLTDVDLAALAAEHARSQAQVTMALIPNPNPQKYGGVIVDEGGWVREFTRLGDPRPSFHFIGVQMAEARVFAALADHVPAASVGGLYTPLLAASKGIHAFVSSAAFDDIGTPADYLDTSLAVARREGLAALPTGSRSYVAPGATLDRTAVWDDVVIEDGSTLVGCVVADGARLPRGSSFTRCAIVPAEGCAPTSGSTRIGDLLVAPFRTVP